MKNILLFIVLSFSLLACSDSESSERTLAKAGFTDIRTEGWSPFSCGEGDTFSTAFVAKNPRGQWTEGVVCCGLVKNCTIRF